MLSLSFQKKKESGLLFALDGIVTPSVLFDLYCLSKHKMKQEICKLQKNKSKHPVKNQQQ